jgi:hypothetical protein
MISSFLIKAFHRKAYQNSSLFTLNSSFEKATAFSIQFAFPADFAVIALFGTFDQLFEEESEKNNGQRHACDLYDAQPIHFKSF